MKVIIKKDYTVERINKLKEKYSLSTKELSKKTNIFYSKMCKIVSGRVMPSLCDLIRICNTFNKKISEILDYSIVDNKS